MRHFLILNASPNPNVQVDKHYRLLLKLSQFAKITLLTQTYSSSSEKIEHTPSFLEYRLPKEQIHESFQAKIKPEKVDLLSFDIMCALSAKYPAGFHKYYNLLYQDCDVIIHLSAAMMEFDLFWGMDEKPRVYMRCSTYSISAKGARKRLRKYVELLKGLEENLIKKADLVYKDGSWNNKSEEIIRGINDFKKKQEKKTILVLNHFKISSPMSGGQIRIHHLYGCLSTKYNIVYICFHRKKEFAKIPIMDHFLQFTIPKTDEHINEEKSLNGENLVNTKDIVSSYMCSRNDFLTSVVKNLYLTSAVVIMSHPYMIHALNGLEGKPLIYESHNCETMLKSFTLTGHPQFERLINQVRNVERLACERSCLIITVSEEDRGQFYKEFCDQVKEIRIIKNGVTDRSTVISLREENISKRNLFGNGPNILFIGSAHAPNVEAVSFIVNYLASVNPTCNFIVAGAVGKKVMGTVPQNVILLGEIDNSYKEEVLSLADVAINPIYSGSGSNIKLAEYFASKIPTITTAFGARGYQIVNGQHALICELEEFNVNIDLLLKNQELQSILIHHAYDYSKQLNWSVLAEQFDRVLQDIISKFP